MKNYIFGLLSGVIITASLTIPMAVYADNTDRNIEYIFNRVYDSATNTLKISIP